MSQLSNKGSPFDTAIQSYLTNPRKDFIYRYSLSSSSDMSSTCIPSPTFSDIPDLSSPGSMLSTTHSVFSLSSPESTHLSLKSDFAEEGFQTSSFESDQGSDGTGKCVDKQGRFPIRANPTSSLPSEVQHPSDAGLWKAKGDDGSEKVQRERSSLQQSHQKMSSSVKTSGGDDRAGKRMCMEDKSPKVSNQSSVSSLNDSIRGRASAQTQRKSGNWSSDEEKSPGYRPVIDPTLTMLGDDPYLADVVDVRGSVMPRESCDSHTAVFCRSSSLDETSTRSDKDGVDRRAQNGQLFDQDLAQSNETHLCQVCGDIAAGFHCGAFVCEACKKFFVRCLKQEGGIKFMCLRNNQCEINKDTRTQCQHCRYKKCLYIGMYRPGGTNVSSEICHIPCSVCGAPSSGYHFGAITCEGCKGFFRRTIKERDIHKYHCSRDLTCVITSSTRNICKYCRYQKCLDAGMKSDGSRIGRQPNSIKHATMVQLKQIKTSLGLNTDNIPIAISKTEPLLDGEYGVDLKASNSCTDTNIYDVEAESSRHFSGRRKHQYYEKPLPYPSDNIQSHIDKLHENFSQLRSQVCFQKHLPMFSDAKSDSNHPSQHSLQRRNSFPPKCNREDFLLEQNEVEFRQPSSQVMVETGQQYAYQCDRVNTKGKAHHFPLSRPPKPGHFNSSGHAFQPCNSKGGIVQDMCSDLHYHRSSGDTVFSKNGTASVSEDTRFSLPPGNLNSSVAPCTRKGSAREMVVQECGNIKTDFGHSSFIAPSMVKGASVVPSMGKCGSAVSSMGKGASNVPSMGKGACVVPSMGKGANMPHSIGKGANMPPAIGESGNMMPMFRKGASMSSDNIQTYSNTAPQHNDRGPLASDHRPSDLVSFHYSHHTKVSTCHEQDSGYHSYQTDLRPPADQMINSSSYEEHSHRMVPSRELQIDPNSVQNLSCYSQRIASDSCCPDERQSEGFADCNESSSFQPPHEPTPQTVLHPNDQPSSNGNSGEVESRDPPREHTVKPSQVCTKGKIYKGKVVNGKGKGKGKGHFSKEDLDTVIESVQLAYVDLSPILERDKEIPSVKHDDNMQTLWNYMMTQFKQCARATVKFAKKVPGFSSLAVVDQISILQTCMYPIVLSVLSLTYHLESETYNYFNFSDTEEKIITDMFHPFTYLIPTFHMIGQSVQEMEMDTVEVAFLCAIHLSNEGNVKDSQSLLVEALMEYEKRKDGEDTGRHAMVLLRLGELVRANIAHQKSIFGILSQPDKFQGLEIPQLFQETYLTDP